MINNVLLNHLDIFQKTEMSDDDMFLSSPTPSPSSVGYSSLTPHSLFTPSAPTDFDSPNLVDKAAVPSQISSTSQIEELKEPVKVFQVKVEFQDRFGNNVTQTRYSDNEEIVNILGSLVRSNDQHFMKSTVKKMCNSTMFQSELQDNVLQNLSKQFSTFLSSEQCPLKNDKIFNSVKDFSELNLNEVLFQCFTRSPELVDAFSILCFGKAKFEEVVNLPDSKYIKQRLLAVLSISAISRNQRINLYQRVLGEFLKLKNTSKQSLQLIHRLGLSLVSVTIRSDQDRIAQHFLKEVKERKSEIELWATRRKMLENMVEEELQRGKLTLDRSLYVKFTPDTFIPQILDLGMTRSNKDDAPSVVKIKPDKHVLEMVREIDSIEEALDCHLASRPALIDITFDNVDIGRVPNEFIAGESKDQSLHWTSSIIVEDIVHGKEIEDTKVDRSLSATLEEKLHVTKDEQEHLCKDYSLLVMNIISDNWPNLLPDIKKVHIPHQYSKEFEQNVPMWTGPLIFESENNLDGMKKVITHLVDVVCPVTENIQGKKVPVYPTTFSGDNKSEQSARSAQLALADNGDMKEQLAFIEGRHEMLHFQFMFVEVILNILADKNNLEEAASLSRLIQWLNPKLVNKHAKDDYYKFRDTLTDIYIALLGENLRHFFNIDNLEKDVTPESIKNENIPSIKQSLIFELVRCFVISTHHDFNDCKSSFQAVKPLLKFYPHQEYVRKQFKDAATKSDTESEDVNVDADAVMKEQSQVTKSKAKPDLKYDYAGAMLSLLGQFELLIDSVKEGNGLNVFLIQKKLHKIVFSTGHKNYACSMSSFKQIVMSHPNPQFAHHYMWNQFCGRAGKGNKMARDQREEHLNRFLKDGFRTLGVNLNPTNATRINNSADLGQTLVRKVTEFHKLDVPGKNHTQKDRKPIRKKIAEVFKKEEVAKFLPGRNFKGPTPERNVSLSFDEAKYRVWHQSKENELKKFSKFRETYQDN